ncbi:MAG: GerAB/ArcD/ProY family transporter, partial [Clostridia bacterium]|nr:GerAB/ArcD/ProY family transporter [Clostridia bacterium]
MNRAFVRQNFAFCVLFLMGPNLLIGSSYRAKQDTWVSILIASALTVILALIIARISQFYPEKDIFGLLKLLPKWIAFPLIGLVAFYCFEQAVIT